MKRSFGNLAATTILIERRKLKVVSSGGLQEKRRHELYILMCCGLETMANIQEFCVQKATEKSDSTD
jgi:hypothetical protein